MTYARSWTASALTLLLVMPSLFGCASPSMSSPQPPVVDSTLMENNSPRADAFSKEVQELLKEVADFLQSLPRKPLPCKPNSASCT